ncbi:MAG: GWxTD domain-containing protein [Flavobacteriales bacterium]
MKNNTHILLFFFIFIASCYTPNRGRVTYVSPYAPVTEEKKILKCDILPYSHSSDSIRLYFILQGSQLHYQRNSAGAPLEANIKFYYQLLKQVNGKYVTCDSSALFYKDRRKDKAPKELMGFIHLAGKRGYAYKLKLVVSDLHTRGRADKEYYFSLASANSPFLYLNLSSGEVPSFQPKTFGDSVKLESDAMKNKKLFIRYYNRNFGTSPPPFSSGKPATFSYRADSVFTYQANEKGKISFRKKGNGFYHVQLDSTTREGYTIYCLPVGYPSIRSGVQMLDPLLFICSKDEYTGMITKTDHHKAAEDFWISRSTTRERAREVIRQFYQRVEEANKEFTSYIEGWRTDRGMVYIVFGKPGFMQITEFGETWTYRTGMNSESMHFTFRKAENPFTENDYILDRNMMYKPVWYNAVENWRMGRVYKLNQF